MAEQQKRAKDCARRSRRPMTQPRSWRLVEQFGETEFTGRDEADLGR